MEPANNNPLAHLFAQFSNFVTASNVDYPAMTHEVLRHVGNVDAQLVLSILEQCRVAKEKSWGTQEAATALQNLRQVCRNRNLMGHLQLISSVAFCAIFANKCTSKQGQQIAMELISDALESQVQLPLAFLNRFPKELQSEIYRCTLAILTSYPDLHKLEAAQVGFMNIFEICRKGISEPIDQDVKLHAFLQFPNTYWTLLTPHEKNFFLFVWVQRAHISIAARGGLNGFNYLSTRFNQFQTNRGSSTEWSERFVFLREVGCTYMFGRYLNALQGTIETCYPGYLHNLCVAAIAYAGLNQNVTGQIAFLNRLLPYCDNSNPEYKVMHLVFAYFYCISVPRLPFDQQHLYTFLIRIDILARECPQEFVQQFTTAAVQAVEQLRDHGIHAGVGRRAFFTSFFHPAAPLNEVQTVFNLFSEELREELLVCPIELKESIAQAFLVLLQAHPDDPAVPLLIDHFPKDTPCYPQLLCKKIVPLLQSDPGRANEFLLEARALYTQLQEQPNSPLLRENLDVLEELFRNMPQLTLPRKERRKK